MHFVETSFIFLLCDGISQFTLTYICACVHTRAHTHTVFRISQDPYVLSNAAFILSFALFQGVSLVSKLTSLLIIFKLFIENAMNSSIAPTNLSP